MQKSEKNSRKISRSSISALVLHLPRDYDSRGTDLDSRAAVCRDPLSSGISSVNATTPTPDTAEIAFSETAVLEALGGDRELVAIIARAFVDEAPKLLARLRQAAAEGGARELQAAAHALRGSVRFFGVNSLNNAAQSLETDARSGNLERAQAALAQLEVEAPRLAAQLTTWLASGSGDSRCSPCCTSSR